MEIMHSKNLHEEAVIDQLIDAVNNLKSSEPRVAEKLNSIGISNANDICLASTSPKAIDKLKYLGLIGALHYSTTKRVTVEQALQEIRDDHGNPKLTRLDRLVMLGKLQYLKMSTKKDVKAREKINQFIKFVNEGLANTLTSKAARGPAGAGAVAARPTVSLTEYTNIVTQVAVDHKELAPKATHALMRFFKKQETEAPKPLTARVSPPVTPKSQALELNNAVTGLGISIPKEHENLTETLFTAFNTSSAQFSGLISTRSMVAFSLLFRICQSDVSFFDNLAKLINEKDKKICEKMLAGRIYELLPEDRPRTLTKRSLEIMLQEDKEAKLLLDLIITCFGAICHADKRAVFDRNAATLKALLDDSPSP
jgi:hypothetical protein